MTTVALYLPDEGKVASWIETLRKYLPNWSVVPMSRANPEAVEYVVVWRPRTGDIARFPKLRAIVSIGAGIDHILADRELPDTVPIIRTVGDDLTQRMKEYVALHVLRHHRDMPRQIQAQVEREWHAIVVPTAPKRVVGVMGLGNLGRPAAELLSQIGFATRGWSRSAKVIKGVLAFAGKGSLPEFLSGCEILVNLLPLTPETTGILNADFFAQLPPGACIINCARGSHLVEADLLSSIANGQIKQATLDVFHVEPLPAKHPFWSHPAITVTPHVASQIDAAIGARLIAENLRIFAKSGTCPDITDATRGY